MNITTGLVDGEVGPDLVGKAQCPSISLRGVQLLKALVCDRHRRILDALGAHPRREVPNNNL